MVNINILTKIIANGNQTFNANDSIESSNKSITSSFSRGNNDVFYTQNKFSIKRAKVSLQTAKAEERKTYAPLRNQQNKKLGADLSLNTVQASVRIDKNLRQIS